MTTELQRLAKWCRARAETAEPMPDDERALWRQLTAELRAHLDHDTIISVDGQQMLFPVDGDAVPLTTSRPPGPKLAKFMREHGS